MAKRPKKQEEVQEGLPLWMGTFSDLVTLLLTFFVLMMSMAAFDDPYKVDMVFESLHEALGPKGFTFASLGSSNKKQAATVDERREEAIQPIKAALRSALAEHLSDDVMSMVADEQEIRVRLDDRVLFRPGSAELHPAAYALLSDLAGTLEGELVDIRIEAHTDASGTEADNWKVSADRSLAVVAALRDRGTIPGERLEAVAYGEFRPATTIGEDKAWNRRVEILLRSDEWISTDAVLKLKDGAGNGR